MNLVQVDLPIGRSRGGKNDGTAIGAHGHVAASLRRGLSARHPCCVCGKPETIAHHEDYQHPLRVAWLCRSCHGKRHAELKKRSRTRRDDSTHVRISDDLAKRIKRSAKTNNRSVPKELDVILRALMSGEKLPEELLTKPAK